MNALNEINKVLSSVSYYTHRHGNSEEEWLTAEQMAVSSIKKNNNIFLPIYLLSKGPEGLRIAYETQFCS